ncbi:MAG: hypothetical protein QXP66_00850 [Candidatus Aenigmatarchaeota archaeon]
MIITKIGKELVLRRLYTNFVSPGYFNSPFSGLNYFIFGTQYLVSNDNENATSLVQAKWASPMLAPLFVSTPYLGIKFTTSFNESAVPNANSGIYNEIGLAYVHGYSGIYLSGNPGQLDSGYTLFFYSKIHDLNVVPSAGGTYSITITIYYP